MADTVTSNVLHSSTRRHVVQLLNDSDGTGESAVVKVDVSSLLGDPDTVSIREVEYSIQGFSAVKLYFDATSDSPALYLGAGNGYKDFRLVGGLHDPKATGYTGDLVLTTEGAAAGASYDILLHVMLHA